MFASFATKLLAPVAAVAAFQLVKSQQGIAKAECAKETSCSKCQDPSNLNGIWVNEAGSVMKIQARQGVITGAYHSALGNAKGCYFVLGTYNNNSPHTTVGWSVAWKNNENGDSESNSSWTGQLVNDSIHATWMLTRKSDNNEAWAATRVGHSIFHKVENLEDPCPDYRLD